MSALPFVGDAIKALGDVVDGLHTSDEERMKGELALRQLDLESNKLETELAKAQIAVNLESAKHPSLFVAGARSAAIWVCVAGLAYAAIAHALLSWGWYTFQALGIIPRDLVPPPNVEVETLLSLLGALLMGGTWRTIEKVNGVETKRTS